MSSAQPLVVPGYEVVHYLGAGARSTIWQVRQRQTGAMFALKRVVRRQSTDARFIQQALNEHTIGSQLDHPVIRKIHRLRRIKRWMALREIHLFMEFCEGRTVQEDRPTHIAEVVRVFAQVADALKYMNARGFVHADMKPNNIVVGLTGEAKIIDLGQSCTIGTVKDRIQGTPDFIAPEQVHRQPLDSRTDVYNFGAAIYWVLTGKAIPTALPQQGAVTLKKEMRYIPPETLNPDIPPALSKLISDCVETQPARRPDSMREVCSRLGLIAHTIQRHAEPSGSE